MKSHDFFRLTGRLGLIQLLLLLTLQTAYADSATWNLNPSSGDWNTPTNWTPATVPNGLSDVATFEASNVTSVSLSSSVTLKGIDFQAGASAFTLTSRSGFATFLINGVGIKNDSGIEQTFVADVQGRDQGEISFAGSATARNATYICNGASVRGSFGGGTSFFNTSTAAAATFIADGGHADNASGGGVLFFDSSTASSATFTIDGGTVSGATGGHVEFVHTSTADHATLTANGGTNGGAGGTIFFLDDSTGEQANVVLFGNGTLNLSGHSAPGITVGTLQGDGGLVMLGSSKIRVNNRSDITFGGVISGNGALEKGADGKLDLTNANTYTGGTKVTDGTLLIDNVAGSGTGPGPVRVKSGALGGNGTIAGKVMIGAGIPGDGAFLTPGASFGNPGTFTILGQLRFNSDGFFNVGFRNDVVGQVIANGVTINSEAQFAFFNNHGVTFPVGMVLIVLSNTAGTPIFGEFENLPDGLVFTSEGNTFQVSYTGGDGNDLTLTVVP
jgi:fibronectin-binding autotransporter adhesin